MYAAQNGYASVVDYLAKECDADVNIKDRVNKNALHWACRYSNQKVVAKLLDLRIEYNAKDAENQTPWNLATIHKNTVVEEMMKKYDVKVQAE